jgi:cytochrome P450
MSHVQKTYNTPEGMHIEEIRQTCNVFAIAGSETTATLLSGVTYLSLKNPPVYQKLVNEIRQTFNKEEQITFANVNNLKYESAVLEEALRIFPPVAGSQSRFVPPEGHVIAGRFVPGNSLVGVNQWSAYHSSSNFKDPYNFIPERWLGDPKYKDDKRKVLQPFSVGPRNCIGQNLAYAEVRVVLARILWNFDIELCEESQDWMERLEIYMLWKKQPLMVKLTPVNRSVDS